MKVTVLGVKQGASKEEIVKAVSEAIGEDITKEEESHECNHSCEFTISAKGDGESVETEISVEGCTGGILSASVPTIANFLASLNGIDHESISAFCMELHNEAIEILKKGE